jgi:hypothetical protein
MSTDLSDARQRDLEALAEKRTLLAALLGGLAGPLGYVYVGQWRWAVINFLTLNYLLAGIALVPLHTVAMILGARWRLRRLRGTDQEGDGLAYTLGAWYGRRLS